jgi:cytochrome c oxidase subunit II
MFSNASNFVYGVDLTFAIILGASVFFLVTVTVTMIWFVIRYRRSKNPQPTQIKESVKLEIIWTIIPTILVLVMFYFGWAGYRPMRTIPADAIPIKVFAQMWSWSFEYENGKISDTLVIPQGKPVRLDMESRDVLHSFYIPAFRVKEDIVPGRINNMWFIGQEVGTYTIFCAEYCGDLHSYMLSKTVVLPEGEYLAWYNDTTASVDPPGLQVLKRNACLSCHSLDGTKLIGPSFKGIWGKQEVVITGNQEREITVDEDYIRRSIYDPDSELVKGYNSGLMISYEEIVSEEEILYIIEYIKTLD